MYCASGGIIENYDITYRRVGSIVIDSTDIYLQGPIRRGFLRAAFNSTIGLGIYGTGYADSNSVIWCPVVDIDGMKCTSPVLRNTAAVGYIEGVVRSASRIDRIIPTGVAVYDYSVTAAAASAAFYTRGNITSYNLQTSAYRANSSGALSYSVDAAGLSTLTLKLTGLPASTPSSSSQIWSNSNVLTKVA